MLLHCAKTQELDCAAFYEPDINNELTAIAIAPSKLAQKLTSGLPLALKEVEEKQAA